MKLTKILPLFLCVAAGLMASCSSDETSDPGPGPNEPGELILVAIDTAKVITMGVNGTNPTTVLNRLQNSNSYFGGLSISPDGTKFAYSDYQMTGQWPDQVRTRQIRVSNIDGSADHVAYEATNDQVSFNAVTFCDNDKIFFVEETSFPDASRVLHVIKADGTGLETLQGQYNVAGITNSLDYYVLNASESQNNPIVQIIDRNGDGGAGGMYHNESFAGEDHYMIGEGVFSKDGKKVIIPYRSGADAKARIIDMDTKTSETVTLVSGIAASWYVYNLALSSDGNRGIVTIAGENMPKSKTYLFNLETGEVAAPFENNDENVMQVYIH